MRWGIDWPLAVARSAAATPFFIAFGMIDGPWWLLLTVGGLAGAAIMIAVDKFWTSRRRGPVCDTNESESDGRLTQVVLVPVQVFGAEDGYGLMDSVSAWSDCNRAVGHIYRRDDEWNREYRDPADVITVYVPESELAKFDKKFGGA